MFFFVVERFIVTNPFQASRDNVVWVVHVLVKMLIADSHEDLVHYGKGLLGIVF